MSKSNLGVYGLGVMGSNIALNVLDKGFSVSVYNRDTGEDQGTVQSFISTHKSYEKLVGYTDIDEFVSSLESPRKILLMIKAGSVVDNVINQLTPFLEIGDILIDGGNSHFHDTNRRIVNLKEKGVDWIGAGISGGQKGARNGPSIMPGGSEKAFHKIEPILTSIAAKTKDGIPCCSYVGELGSGHFVKMVHNGIEYAEMQLIAEIYEILKLFYSNLEIADIFENWSSGNLGSYLLEISSLILKKTDDNGFLVDQILDKAGNKGTGSWSSKEALELGTVNSLMTSSVFARYISSFKEERVQNSQKLPPLKKTEYNVDLVKLSKAYEAARIINHHQGFELIRLASLEYDWDVNLSNLSLIWTNGCIIKSKLMETLTELFQDSESIIRHSESFNKLASAEKFIDYVIDSGLKLRTPTYCFSSARNYWVGITSEQSSANLIQAQRDFFGAHTYQLVEDASGSSYSSNWESDD